MAGLVGIAKDNSVWATLTTSQSDAAEGYYGEELAKEIAAAPVDGVRPELTSRLFSLLKGEAIEPPLPDLADIRVFAFSLCPSTTNAGPWLHYAQHGTGVAIGFDAHKRPIENAFSLIPVTYDPIEQRDLVRQVLRRVDSAIDAMAAAIPAQGAAPLALSLAAHAALGGVRVLGAAIKAPAFQAEQEWRLISFELKDEPDDNPLTIGFRAVGQRLVSYGVAAYPKGVPLSEVVLGYSSPIRPADDALLMLVPKAKITKSEVPVRP
jgi:hypothetical protein